MIGLPWKIIGPAVAIIAVAGLVYWAGYSRRDADDLRDQINTRERIENALDRPDGCHWLDRLQSACE